MNKPEALDAIFPFVSKASRYLGNEVNAVRKDLSQVDLRVALAFPDAYEVGMSHLGFQILYHLLNLQPHIACERVFTPWVDMEAVLRENAISLCSLESRLPLRDFHIVGFSLQYELGYSNILKMLKLAGIPLLAGDRDKSHPLIIAGGPCTFNPEPIAEFFDAIVIGEGEEVVPELCSVYLKWKTSRTDKSVLLDKLADIKGIYVPSLFQIEYLPDGAIKNITSKKHGYAKVMKRYVSNFNAAQFCNSFIVPFMQVIHDRISLEIARGCSRGCRFCMAGMIYRPVRERSMQNILEIAETTLANTGHEELSLASLSTGDFTGIDMLLKTLMQQHQKDRIAISLPSLRAETLCRSLMEEIKQVRKTGFTIAPEAGTQRLRDVINKNLTEDDIIQTVSEVFKAGWQLIKLYFMIGLPTETREDVKGIVHLAHNISALGKKIKRGNQITVSISTFVPKSHTPFQWVAQLPPDQIRDKQDFLRENLRRHGIRLKWHNPEMSILEGVFARGDRRLSEVLIKAHLLGAGFDGWSDYFNPSLWDRAFLECGIDKHFYLRERTAEERLPWEHICCGVSLNYLKEEYQKSLKCSITNDCRTSGCQGCGLCTEQQIEVKSPVHQQDIVEAPASATLPVNHAEGAPYRYRCCFSKSGSARFLSHLELASCIARTLRRAKLPLQYSQGFHPHPRITFYDALPVGMESQREVFDMELTLHIAPDAIPEIINHHLPSGLMILGAEEITLKKILAPDTMPIRKYEARIPAETIVPLPSAEAVKDAIAAFLSQKEFYVQTNKKGSSVSIDVRPLVSHLVFKDNALVELALSTTTGKIPRVSDILGDILGLGEKERKALQITKLAS